VFEVSKFYLNVIQENLTVVESNLRMTFSVHMATGQIFFLKNHMINDFPPKYGHM
jgi:hypothetical protein